MGGDRDGNPNVTSETTWHVAHLSRWIATDLYLREVESLHFEVRCGEVWGSVGEVRQGVNGYGSKCGKVWEAVRRTAGTGACLVQCICS